MQNRLWFKLRGECQQIKTKPGLLVEVKRAQHKIDK